MSEKGIKTNTDVRLLPIDMLHPNPWNPNVCDAKTMRRIRKAIERDGFDDPIICRPHPEKPGEWQIVDGLHRWTLLKEMGATHIPATVGDYTDQEAKLKTITTNYLHGSAVPLRLAALIHDLNREMTLDEIEAALPYERVELEDSLELLKLPAGIDVEAQAREAQERKKQPVFISATIYRDHARSLHDFVEQALLESEATFATINVKIECGEDHRDVVIEAMQNLKAVADRGSFDGEDAPVVTRFALLPDQAHVIDQVITQVAEQLGPDVKNPRGRALEIICAAYQAGADR
ncbi:MAG TPA: ParB/RepB/Spo0J family partition protein [Symbiobacteriaceae bacterium]|nr:ParB/RepB/Spo0J family partition protein [Symbiobacteriaceae bacterium]